MKALSILEPWASLIALGHKKIETRSWPTSWRGPLAIHASKGFPPYAREFAAELYALGILPNTLRFGCVIATCRLADCQRTDRILDINADEMSYGDFTPGRYGWFLDGVVALPAPVPAKGSLGLWDWEQPLEVRG